MKRLTALLLVAALGPAAAETVPVTSGEVVWARFGQPTDRYDHRVFGAAPLWAGMEMSIDTCPDCASLRLTEVLITLPADRVFEDLEPRIADLDGDGRSEVVVVETDIARGATLAIYDASGKRAATTPVGQTHRWLAPAGIGDFDGDGRVEIAYVDRPHLARELVMLRYAAGVLTEIARAPGYSNHRFGEGSILGGVRSCAGQDELVLATADWTRIVAVTLVAGEIHRRDLATLSSDAALRNALACR